VNRSGEVLPRFQFAFDERLVMTTFAVASASSLRCQDSTCLRTGSKFRCIRSTPTETQSISENDFECFASTGVNTRKTMFPNLCDVETIRHRQVSEDGGFCRRYR
jgi:hypothetical protein